jgi:hypothetical protein
MKTLNLESFNRAGYPLLWVLSQEPSRVISECQHGAKFHWDVARGLSPDLQHYQEMDPVSLLDNLSNNQEAIVFLENYHHYLENPMVIQSVLNLVPRLKSNGTTLVILAPELKITPELSSIVRVLHHNLPSHSELSACLGNFDEARWRYRKVGHFC